MALVNKGLPMPASLQAEVEKTLLDIAAEEAAEAVRKQAASTSDPEALPEGAAPGDGSSRGFDVVRGFMTVWHTGAGDPPQQGVTSNVSVNNLKEIMRLKADGKQVFSLTEVARPPQATRLPCILHPDHPDIEKLRALGILAVCDAKSFATPFDVEQHARVKHKATWAARERQETIERDDRQRQMVESLVALAQRGS